MDSDLIFGTETGDSMMAADLEGTQIAAAPSADVAYDDALARPFDAAQVVVPAGEDVVRVDVTPGEIVELPFPADAQFLARIDNGNLAIKVGDVTVILQGYVEAAGQAAPVIEASNGQPLDIATILASTDPNIDIQTAAGPAAGPQGQGADNSGGILTQFGEAGGLGGFEGAGAQEGTDGLTGGTVDQTGTLFRQFGLLTINEAPVAQDDSAKTNEDTAISGQVVVNDPEGDTLVYTVVGGLPSGVTFDPVTGKWDFDPTTLTEYQELDDGGSKTIQFDYKAFDGTSFSNTATVTIEVDGVNDAPVAQNDSGATDEDTPINGQVTATDVDKTDSLTYSVVGKLPLGVTFDTTNGKWTFDPTGISDYQNLKTGDSTSIVFDYKANDGTVDSNTATVTINITGVNDAPVVFTGLNNITTDEDTPAKQFLGLTIIDPDSAGYTVTQVGALPTGVTYNSADKSISVDPVGHYDYLKAGETLNLKVDFEIDDGDGGKTAWSVPIVINGVNDAPVAVADAITVDEGGTVTVLNGGGTSVLANDTDAEGSTLTAALVSGPAHGTLFFNSDGTFTYKHDGSETLTDSFTYKANDGAADSAPVTVNITVNPVNDAPFVFIGLNNITTNEDTPATQFLGLTVIDPDSAGYTVKLVGDLPEGVTYNAAAKSLTVNPVGHYDYLKDGETLTLSANFEIDDGNGGKTPWSVPIVITGVNDAPVSAVADLVITNNGLTAFDLPNWAVFANDKDPDSNLDFFIVGPSTANIDVAVAPHKLTITDLGPLGGDFSYTAFDTKSHDIVGPAKVTVTDTPGSTLTGTDSNEILVGSAAAETIHGGKGNDIIIGHGGGDTIFGDAGDDTVFFDHGSKIDGGAGGMDVMSFADSKLDFADNLNAADIKDIEVISMQAKVGGEGAQSLVIGAESVKDISEQTIAPGGVFTNDRDVLRIDGDTVDQLYLSISKGGGHWTDTGEVVNGYHVFAHETAANDPGSTDAYVMVHAAVVANVHLNTDT